MRFAALLAVLALVAWLTMRETTATPSPGAVSSTSQGQRVVDDARRKLDDAAARNGAAADARVNVDP